MIVGNRKDLIKSLSLSNISNGTPNTLRLTPLLNRANLESTSREATVSRGRTLIADSVGQSSTEKLTHRNSKSLNLKISPDMAAEVVKHYILPMFEAETRSYKDKKRISSFGRPKTDRNRNSTLSVVDGTVYNELKLSEILSQEIKSLKEELDQQILCVKHSEQETKLIKTEYETIKEKLFRSEANVLALNLEHFEISRELQQAYQHKSFLEDQILEYQKQNIDLDSQKICLGKQLHDETALNDKLKNIATQLHHGNSLLVMQNEIIGERLKGLFESFDLLVKSQSAEVKLADEFEILTHNNQVTSENYVSLNREIKDVITKRDEFFNDTVELIELKSELQGQRDRIYKTFKEKVVHLEAELSKSQQENAYIKVELSTVEKKFHDISNEYNRLRQRLKQVKFQTELDERFCKNCQRPYLETENYNWSCKTHKSKLNGDVYWCCGKTGKDAIGCISSKHTSKDEEDIELNKGKSNKCSNCKALGHSSHECPKDPNTRTKYEPKEELDRITNSARSRSKSTIFESDLQERLITLLKDNNILNEETDYDFTDEGSEIEDKMISFKDLMKIKKELPFESFLSRVKVEATTNEEEAKNNAIETFKNSRRESLRFADT